tara:strand:- start:44 stop:292 length:249 start_codon:yes stop_codon:yes gene_type:complete
MNYLNQLFAVCPRYAIIQGMSIQAGRIFAELYKEDPTSDVACDALEGYKALRRMLPRECDSVSFLNNRHIGAVAAHEATQGL